MQILPSFKWKALLWLELSPAADTQIAESGVQSAKPGLWCGRSGSSSGCLSVPGAL